MEGENVQTTHQTLRSLREGGSVCKLMSWRREFIFASEKYRYHAVSYFFVYGDIRHSLWLLRSGSEHEAESTTSEHSEPAESARVCFHRRDGGAV
jgi:hypothetical protein